MYCELRSANNMGCAEEIENILKIKVYKADSQEEIFSSEAWRRAFDINESIYTDHCHEFYSTYEFDKVCADDVLRTKMVIKFQVCGRAHRGLCSDDNFNAKDYWISISSTDELHFLSAPTYYRALDTTTLRELIDSAGRLIPEVPALGVPHVAIPRGLRPSMKELYDWMGCIEILQGAIERMAYRQSYH
ncbi:hypothetical protein Tco_1067317 [Tanacetum coccineum]|uniref:Uncharacterized protein n=1 Tax=Tanacetum coccineum TaxID=301880 RepID=A0ABQ5HD47_9ASTR